MWYGPGWGMPWGMFIFPLFFLICIGFMFYFLSRGSCPFGVHRSSNMDTNKELLEEVRRLRQEIEELRKEKKS